MLLFSNRFYVVKSVGLRGTMGAAVSSESNVCWTSCYRMNGLIKLAGSGPAKGAAKTSVS